MYIISLIVTTNGLVIFTELCVRIVLNIRRILLTNPFTTKDKILNKTHWVLQLRLKQFGRWSLWVLVALGHLEGAFSSTSKLPTPPRFPSGQPDLFSTPPRFLSGRPDLFPTPPRFLSGLPNLFPTPPRFPFGRPNYHGSATPQIPLSFLSLSFLHCYPLSAHRCLLATQGNILHKLLIRSSHIITHAAVTVQSGICRWQGQGVIGNNGGRMGGARPSSHAQTVDRGGGAVFAVEIQNPLRFRLSRWRYCGLESVAYFKPD